MRFPLNGRHAGSIEAIDQDSSPWKGQRVGTREVHQRNLVT